jgi:predicted dehydrogenase
MVDMPLTRRHVLAAAASAALAPSLAFAEDAPPLKAAIIGHTGRGDYGHSLEVCFNNIPDATLVALSDPDEAGRAKAAAKAKPARTYADYREMLEKEKPQLVAVAPRWSEHHREMADAAFSVGAHVYMEKPIAPTLTDADAILAAAAKAGRKIAVAHQMRMGPSVVYLKKRVEEGLLGDLLEMRAIGKQDARAGGEDMLVLGVHLFDLMRMFAGTDALWCAARVTQAGRDITLADARSVKEQIGPVAGDEIEAQFAFANGIAGSFTSRGRLRDQSGRWGVELVGSKASARILTDPWPSVFFRPIAPWTADGREERWIPLEGDPGRAPGVDKSTPAANRRLVEDLMAAAREGRDPVCSGANATKALEMVMAVYHAALRGTRVALPLADREHPLMKT